MFVKSSRAEFASYLRSRGASVDRQDLSDGATRPEFRRSYARLTLELWRALASSPGLIVAMSALALATALAVAPAALTKVIIDDLLSERRIEALSWLPADGLQQLYLLGALVAAASIIELVLRVVCRCYVTSIATRAQVRLKRRLFERVIRLPLHSAQQLKSGGATSILRDDSLNLPELAVNLFYESWRSALRVFGSLVILLLVDWRLLLGMLCVAPLIYLNHRNWTRRIRPLYTDLAEHRQRLDAHVTEVFGGLRIVRAFGRVRAEERRFVRNHHFLARMLLYLSRVRIIESVWEGIATVASIAALVYGGTRVIKGELTLGDLVMFLSYFALLVGPLEQLANSASSLHKGFAGFDRALDWLVKTDSHPHRMATRKLSHEAVRGEFELRDVSFTYPGARSPALSNINLHVRPGEMIALVGYSGAGKSTLCNLIARFYEPTSGSIELDGNDVRDIDLENYRSLFGIVEQDVFLFDGTIADNIRYGVPSASLEEVKRAARAAHLHESIERMESGYHTVIGERGQWLSGGQRQRLAIARALLVRPKVLILDEATSNLDNVHEQAIRHTVETLLHGRTCFVIAHRLSTFVKADRIVLLDQGRVAETGSHRELVARRGLYWHLYGDESVGPATIPFRRAA